MIKILDNLADQIEENLALHRQYADDSESSKLMTNNLKEQVALFLARVYWGYPKANYPAYPLWLLENESRVQQWIAHPYMDEGLKQTLYDSLAYQAKFPGAVPLVEPSFKERFIKTGENIWEGITIIEFFEWLKGLAW